METYTIKNRVGEVMHTGEAESFSAFLEAHKQDLRGSNLSDSNLSDSDLSGSNLSGSDLRGSSLSDSDLRGSDLSGSNLSGSNLSGSDLRDSNLRYSDLSGSNLRYSDLSGSNLSDSDLSGSNLSGSNLSGSNLSGSNLSSSDLSGSNLSDSDLRGSSLSDSDLRYSDLSSSTGLLSAAQWLSSNFQHDADGVLVYKAVGSTDKSPPAHWKIEPGAVLTETVNPCRTNDCGCGVNFGTRARVAREFDFRIRVGKTVVWLCRIPWIHLAGVIVPYNTDGKARCEHLELVRELTVDEVFAK